jgi:HSP20 family protein
MNTLSLWTRDPFAEFDALVRRSFAAPATAFTPAAEVARDADDAVVRLEVPGLDVEKDVTVEVTDGRLVVKGERRDEHTDKTDTRSVRELRYGSFRRSFGLPPHVGPEAVSASYDAGVLTIRVAGVYTQPEVRRIPVQAPTA